MHTLADDELAKLKMKFDVAYFVASEQLSLEKYPKIWHGVNLGTSYLNRNAGKEFIHYIADSNRKAISSTIAEAPFFSLLFDSSTDKSNIDNELTLVLWCDLNGEDKKVHTRVSFLSIERLERATAEGLFLSLQHALQSLGIEAGNSNRWSCS